MRVYMNLGYSVGSREMEREITIEDATEAQASLALEGFFKTMGVDLVGEVVVNLGGPENNYVAKEFAFVNVIIGTPLSMWNGCNDEEKKSLVLHAEEAAKKGLSFSLKKV